ncbi:MAG: hypothetical protein REJ50_01270 [Bordetella sp.]|nr:hypothetical protein [Bordetella sp.]
METSGRCREMRLRNAAVALPRLRDTPEDCGVMRGEQDQHREPAGIGAAQSGGATAQLMEYTTDGASKNAV